MVNASEVRDYLRKDRMPTVWCPGCGNGIVLSSILRAIKEADLRKKEVAVISGIGCSSRATGYIDFNTLHTLHGRAIAFATGVKMVNPSLKVMVLTGDGDALAIGGNHFIHACRRNIDLTVIVFNNRIYGMTGGEFSPTTPEDDFSTTSVYGNIDPPFDVVKLAIASGATYVARSTAYHHPLTVQYIKEGILHKGISIIDVITPCPTYYGRYNQSPKPIDMLFYLRDHAVMNTKAKTMSEEELRDKFIIGRFVNIEKEEYTERYAKIIERVSKVKV